MKKSSYIYISASFAVLFVLLTLYLSQSFDANSLIHALSFYRENSGGFLNSTYFALLISGAMPAKEMTLSLNIICTLFSAFLIYLILKKAVTKNAALLFSGIFLSFFIGTCAKTSYVCVAAFLNTFILYVYFMKYSGVVKWYLIEIIIACLALHFKIYILFMFLFPLLAFSKIKTYKTSWTAFVNCIGMYALAFLLYFLFVKSFPVPLFEFSKQSVKEFILQFNFEKGLASAVFLFTLIANFYCAKLTNTYALFGAASFLTYVLSNCMFKSNINSYYAFFPICFVAFSCVLCHLKTFREYKTVSLILCTCFGILMCASQIII